MKKGDKATTLRLPEQVYRALEKDSKKTGYSVNSWILLAIHERLERRGLLSESHEESD